MAEVCERIGKGELVKDVTADLGVTPSTVSEWGALPEFADAYARAREAQAHALAEDAVRAADGVDAQTIAALEVIEAEELKAEALTGPAKGAALAMVASLRSNVVQRDRMRMDARKWLASKIAPRHYGEKQTLEHTGEGGGPLVVEVTRRIVQPTPAAPDVGGEAGA